MGIQSETQGSQQDGFVATPDEIKDSSFQGLGDVDCRDEETLGHSIPCLPGDIWRHIHSLMPMDDAARAACLSQAFLSSWRCYPKLIFSPETVNKQNRSLRRTIQSILKDHSGMGVKILRLHLHNEYACFAHIDGWLKVAVTPGIEELTLVSPFVYKKYSFPCSVLSAGVRNSIQSLHLDSCVFHPTAELGPLRSLTSLRLHSVSITGDELECLLSNTLALESLQLTECNEIISLEIPSVLQQLRFLLVDSCYGLQIIENKGPSISNVSLFGRCDIELFLGESSQTIKVLNLLAANAAGYARANLPSIMPNLEVLNLSSSHEENTPMLPSKFVNLKHLIIHIYSSTLSPSYDYSSLVSFLDASPSLETLQLWVPLADMGNELVGSSPLRQLPEQHHNHLKIVEIIGFHSTKSLVELTCCIVKSVVSLESLTLDTIRGDGRSPCCFDGLGSTYTKFVIKQAAKAVVAIREYIEDKVAPTTKLTVLEHCPRCIAAAVDDGMDRIGDDGLVIADDALDCISDDGLVYIADDALDCISDDGLVYIVDDALDCIPDDDLVYIADNALA